jgi:REP element-mobilizing transposase RayT
VGNGARFAPLPTLSDVAYNPPMSRYRRAKIEGGTFFFTVALADRSGTILVQHIDHLRRAYKFVVDHYPFETAAICILPDHLHAIWSLPKGDWNFALRWSLIKSRFSRALPTADLRSQSQIAKRDKGIWQRRYWERPFATMTTSLVTLTTFILIQSSTDMFPRFGIGHTAVFIDSSNRDCCQWIGVET